MKQFVSIIICFSLFFVLSAPVLAIENTSVVTVSDTGFTFSAITDFIIHIFIPSDNYFNNKIATLNNNANEKLGGVAYLFHMISYFFKTLQTAPMTNFNVSVPDGFFHEGYKGFNEDIFLYAKPFIRILRSSFTGFMCILTSIVCYKKLVKFFEK